MQAAPSIGAYRILVASYPILSYPILSYPILSYPILSYPIKQHKHSRLWISFSIPINTVENIDKNDIEWQAVACAH